jgi:hypothetical protein
MFSLMVSLSLILSLFLPPFAFLSPGGVGGGEVIGHVSDACCGRCHRLLAETPAVEHERQVGAVDQAVVVHIARAARCGRAPRVEQEPEIAAAVREGRRTPRDHAILFRTAALSRSLEIALRTAGVPYQLVRGLEFFKRREIRDVVAWLRLLRNPRDDEAFLRVVNVPSRGVGRQ